MVTVRDPKADPDADGYSDDAVDVNGTMVPIEDGTFEAPREWAERYADREGVAVEDVIVDDADNIENVVEWHDWNEEDWLELHYEQRAEDVQEGRVDDHLEEIGDVETSSTVEDAVDERFGKLDDNED